MRELKNETEQSLLLPKSGQGLYLVVFYRSSECALNLLAGLYGIDRVQNFELVAVDLDRAPLLAERFVLPRTPVLAAIFDGSILCLDEDLDKASCARVATLATRQMRSLLETS